GPGDRRFGPRTVGVEPFDGVVGATRACLALGAGSRPVEQHAEQPRLERPPSLQSPHPPGDREPPRLTRFPGDGTATDGRLGNAQQARLVTADQLGERGLVAGAQPLDESEIVIHAGRGYDSEHRDRRLSVEGSRNGPPTSGARYTFAGLLIAS